MSFTIGLDISTSCTGICVLDEQQDVKILTYLKYPPKLSLWEKADLTRKTLAEIKDEYDLNISHFFVEESLQKFRPGLSSAKTLTTLSKFNGIVCYLGRSTFDLDPVSINVNTARKAVGLKIPRGSNAKEIVHEWVSGEIGYTWPTKILKSGPRKGQEVMLNECYDMADSYLISRAGMTLVNKEA